VTIMIKCVDIKKYYGKGETLCKALDGINLDIKKEEFVAITGKSGSGKSTLLHLMSGINVPTQGKIIVDNEDISEFNDSQIADFRRNKIGMVFQGAALINQYTVLENIMISLTFSKLSNKAKINLISEKLKQFGVENLLNKKAYKLSGGEKQRVAIARAIINDPQIIFADEPTGSLDSDNSDNIMEMLCNLNNLGKTIVLITHDMDIANKASRIIQLKDGKVI